MMKERLSYFAESGELVSNDWVALVFKPWCFISKVKVIAIILSVSARLPSGIRHRLSQMIRAQVYIHR